MARIRKQRRGRAAAGRCRLNDIELIEDVAQPEPPGSKDAPRQIVFEQPITIRAGWDSDAGVWYIEESSLPGLEAEAETLDGLREKVSGAIEDRLRGAARQDVRFELIVPGSVKVGGA